MKAYCLFSQLVTHFFKKLKNGGEKIFTSYLFGKVYLQYRQQPSTLLYSIEIWPTRNSRLIQRESNHFIARCTSMLAWCYLARCLPGNLLKDLFAQYQRFAVCCPQYTIQNSMAFTIDQLRIKLLKFLKRVFRKRYLQFRFVLDKEVKGI